MIVCKDYSTFYTTVESDTTIYHVFCSLYSADVPSPLPTNAVGIENFPQNFPLTDVRFGAGSTLYCVNTGAIYVADDTGEFVEQ